uniref:Cystinosin homolog n=1 Tax=Acrobeloides nanus TaxID=290746 RepID=A0A914EA64_9BILA
MLPRTLAVLFLIGGFCCVNSRYFVEAVHHEIPLTIEPREFDIVKDDNETVIYRYDKPLESTLTLRLNTSSAYLEISPKEILLTNETKEVSIQVLGKSVISLTFIDIYECHDDALNGSCPFNIADAFVRVKVVHSHVISVLVIVSGWIYFVAWSVSFYPQIILNYKRSSVEGLNFDFLVLNIIGFACYTVYNLMMYFDDNVQDIYLDDHPRSLIPVLPNDVVFATHALFACIITVIQCFIYERGQQRVSYTCMGWSTILISFSIFSLALTLFDVINWLHFINNLSYVKMAVTLSKYFPQAILNYRRKSTTGWSIGNVLLDFTGGFMDITQMVLQASNTNDWSGFYGNPVKFGLGLVSMIFDVVFMIQHYCLYRHPITEDGSVYDPVDSQTTTRDTSPGHSTTDFRRLSTDSGNAPI